MISFEIRRGLLNLKGEQMGELLKLGNLLQVANKDYHPQRKYFGLSQKQIDWIWQNRFRCHNLIFNFTPTRKDLIEKTPLVQEVLYILKRLRSDGSILCTRTHNFNQSLVQELYSTFYRDIYIDQSSPQSLPQSLPKTEKSVWQIIRLKFILSQLELMKIKGNKFYITLKGQKALEDTSYLYELLVECLANEWNWAFSDGCHELPLIQDSATFCIYHLHQTCKSWKAGHEIGHEFYKAFPYMGMVLEGVNSIGIRECILAYCIRFLEHFCVPLGLVDERIDDGKYGEYSKYKISNLFACSMIV